MGMVVAAPGLGRMIRKVYHRKWLITAGAKVGEAKEPSREGAGSEGGRIGRGRL